MANHTTVRTTRSDNSLLQGGARKTLSLGFLVALAFGSLSAQDWGKVSGTVMSTDGERLVGCNVQIVGTNLGAATTIDGSYFILNVPPGQYNLQASMIGYQKVLMKGAIVNAGRTTTVDFKLPLEAVEMTEIVSEVVRPDVEREKTRTSAVFRADDVQSVAGIRDVGDILSLASDVTDGHFRGGRTGEEFYTLQGLGITNPLDNSSSFLPIMSAVEEVEVITSGFGAQYGNAQSGVVNISMKEGKSDRWRTRVEVRTRAPGREHFGPSVYDPGISPNGPSQAANPYLAYLLQDAVWRQGNPEASTPSPYYGSMGQGLVNRYARDTAVQLAVATTLYRLQTRRDMYRTYGNQMDYSVEAGTGGPIDEHIRMFLALQSSTAWPVFPTEQPNTSHQIMGNIVTDLGGASTLRISGSYAQQDSIVFPSVNNYTGYQEWLWDRTQGVDYSKRTNIQFGARFTHTFSASTFTELKLNTLWTNRRVGDTPAPDYMSDSTLLAIGSPNFGASLPTVANNSADKINYLGGNDTFRDESTRTISFDGNITSQVTKAHQLNAGLQANWYIIDVTNRYSTTGGTTQQVGIYRAHPVEAAAYAQDKMEFEGMIANIGVRMDAWSTNDNYFTDLFTPYRPIDSVNINNPSLASQKKAPIIGRLQPRAGISFPVSNVTVFHLNYGSYMQRPAFQYVLQQRVAQTSLEPNTLGNPRLEPQVTNSYDIGVTQGLMEGFTLDVSGYYKDVKNQVEQAAYISSQGTSYNTFFNLDYADIRGFRVALTKRRGAFTGSINYQYSVATGKAATPTSATPKFTLDTRTGAVTSDLKDVPSRDILLDFDRTHNLIITAGYTTTDEWGPRFLGTFPFANTTLSAYSFLRSGRPYTSKTINNGLVNGARAPAEYNTNMKLTKRIPNFFGTDATIYAEVFNLFNQKILNYDYVFAQSSASSPNLRTPAYEAYPVDDRANGLLYWWDKDKQGPFAVDQSFLVYGNTPRSFDFGIVIEL